MNDEQQRETIQKEINDLENIYTVSERLFYQELDRQRKKIKELQIKLELTI